MTLVHLKDMDPDDRSFTEVGEGVLDRGAIFTASEVAGTEWYIVEQERCKKLPLEGVRLSLENFQAMRAG